MKWWDQMPWLPSPNSHNWGKMEPCLFTKFNHRLLSSGLHAGHWALSFHWFHSLCSPCPGLPLIASVHGDGTLVSEEDLFYSSSPHCQSNLKKYSLSAFYPSLVSTTNFICQLCALHWSLIIIIEVSTIHNSQMKKQAERPSDMPHLTSSLWNNRYSNTDLQDRTPLSATSCTYCSSITNLNAENFFNSCSRLCSLFVSVSSITSMQFLHLRVEWP